MNKDQTGRSARPEDHPEQHPWEYQAESSDGHALYWCPHCGALCWDVKDNPAWLRFPDISKETR